MLDLDTVRDGHDAHREGARPLRVRDAVAPDVLYCLETTDLAEAAELMRENRVNAIPGLGAIKAVTIPKTTVMAK